MLANDVTVEMVVRIKNTEDSLERFKKILRDKGIEYSEIKIALGDDGYFTVTLTVKGDREIDVDGILSAFNEHEHIQAISF